MKKILLSLTLLFFLTAQAPLEQLENAEEKKPPVKHFAITTWQEKSNLNSQGKSSAILIKARVQNLPENYTMSSFTFGFGSDNTIRIQNVTSNSKKVKSELVDNQLKINFAQPKKNGDIFSIYISYLEKYKEINPYLRQEAIIIPEFAAGANAKVIIKIPKAMEVATLNLNLAKDGNSFIYQNRVPENGVNEIIKLTPTKAVWDVVSRARLKSNQELHEVTIELPDYFFHPRQKVEKRTLLASVIPKNNIKEKAKYILGFDSERTNMTIEYRAKISTGKAFRQNINLLPSEHIKYNLRNRELLTDILQSIKSKPEYQGLPLYAKIGNFTHDYIKYDSEYIGKNPSLRQVIKNKSGVCTEYAKLFNSLARAAGIPSVIVNGMACKDAKTCEGHAWNIIYYNNRWIEVDPTWNLMSGIVSSSHVYFSDNDKQAVGTRYPGDGRIVNLDLEMEMTPTR